MVRVHRSASEWLTVHDVAGLLHVGEETVRRWIRMGKMEAKFFGGRTGYRITRTDLDSFLRSLVSARSTAARSDR